MIFLCGFVISLILFISFTSSMASMAKVACLEILHWKITIPKHGTFARVLSPESRDADKFDVSYQYISSDNSSTQRVWQVSQSKYSLRKQPQVVAIDDLVVAILDQSIFDTILIRTPSGEWKKFELNDDFFSQFPEWIADKTDRDSPNYIGEGYHSKIDPIQKTITTEYTTWTTRKVNIQDLGGWSFNNRQNRQD